MWAQPSFRARCWWPALLGLSWALGACAKIVGIEDTTVTRPNGSAGGNQNTSGSTSAAGAAARAGASNGGASNGGASDAGASDAGASDAGASDAGASNGGTSNAGQSNGGPSNGGTSNAGQSNGGAPSAGASNAGPSNDGPSNGGTSNAGQSNGGSSLGGATATAGTAMGGAAGNGPTGSAGTAGSGGGAGVGECPCSAPKPSCENGKCVVRGPTMAKATSYYIDSTEVSKAHYDAFLAAKGTDTSGQIAECSWNKSYAPEGAPVGDSRPSVNVDWCDAAAYCAWADKRLCGAIGGGPLATADLNSTSKAQWYLACAGPDNERYPYGGFTLKADYCNEYYSGDMADVGKFKQCEGHYAGIFDLVGNAAEWIDSCDTAGGADHSLDNCQLSGGSYINAQYTCQTYFDSPRNDRAGVFGFRCCSK